MNWLVLGWFITCSFVPQNQAVLKDYNGTAYIETSGSYENVLGLSLTTFDVFKIWTELDTYAVENSILSYSPFQSNYRIGAAMIVDPFIIEINHECIHPTLSDLSGRKVGYLSNTTKLSITMHGSYTLFK